jgi:hypothetical protein
MPLIRTTDDEKESTVHRHRIPQTDRMTRIAVAGTAAVASLGLGSTAFAAATTGSTTPAPATTRAHGTAHANVPLPANATLPQIQAAARTDIADRVTDLDAAIAKVQAATYLGGDQATLLGSLQGEVTGLQQLGQKIAGDTDVATAKADYMDIFTQYRVYALELPRTRLVAADDRITNKTGPNLTKVAARIATKGTSTDQAQVAPLLSDLATQVSDATSGVQGQVATLEAATPAAWNVNHALLEPDATATRASVADLKKAASDAKQAAADVGIKRHTKGTTGPGTTGSATPGSGTTAPAPAPAA